jgi:pyruvate dehydrogenase E2 component (dihydrolipoamide acetyltransferase)
MAVTVIMPKQGQSVESCIITKWHKKVGDPVKIGDTLFSYETDKAAFDEEAKVEGVLLAILAEEGEDVPCLQNVCVIGNAGEDISALIGSAAKAPEAKPEEKPAEKPAEPAAAPAAAVPQTTAAQAADGRVFASPRAKAAAERQGLDISGAVPTGPNGRVIERDVYTLAQQGPAVAEAPAAVQEDAKERIAAAMDLARSVSVPLEYEDEKLSTVRKVIAKSLHASLHTMAQLTHHSSFDATNILNYRKQLKERAELLGLGNITLNDIVLYAVSRVLKNHKDCNAHYLEDKIRYFKNVNLGMAVDTPRGLLVPTLYNADKKSLNEISEEAKQLASAAQTGKINPEALQNGTFTVSNLGSLGVEIFTPIINPPQTCILGVCNITYRMKEVKGEFKPYPAMGLSLTYDHRALDGAPASRLLKELCETLENFDVLLAK